MPMADLGRRALILVGNRARPTQQVPAPMDLVLVQVAGQVLQQLHSPGHSGIERLVLLAALHVLTPKRNASTPK